MSKAAAMVLTREQLDPDRFRQVMGEVATPVAVVTTADGGRPHGTTVSAFMSLSLRPPMIAIALDRNSELLDTIRRTQVFGVNVLDAAQADCAMAFAGKGGAAKFEGIDWVLDKALPRLAAAPTWLACEASELVDGGDHVLALGHVIAAESRSSSPLLYHLRCFGTHVALDGSSR